MKRKRWSSFQEHVGNIMGESVRKIGSDYFQPKATCFEVLKPILRRFFFFPFPSWGSLPLTGESWPKFNFFLFLHTPVFPRKWVLAFVSTSWGQQSRRGVQALSISSCIVSCCTTGFQRLPRGLLPKPSLENSICWMLLGMDPEFIRRGRERKVLSDSRTQSTYAQDPEV